MQTDSTIEEEGCGDANDRERLLEIIQGCERCRRELAFDQATFVVCSQKQATAPPKVNDEPNSAELRPTRNPGSTVRKRPDNEDGGNNLSTKKRRNTTFTAKPVSKSISDALLELTPTAEHWWESLRQRVQLAKRPEARSVTSIDGSKTSTQLIELADRIHDSKAHSKFEDLVLGSVCEVIRLQKPQLLSNQDLNRILERDINKNVNSQSLGRSVRASLTGARRANDFINQLYNINWGNRGSDLLKICEYHFSLLFPT
ncbi:MAG: hypothetical protein Q9182_001835 [Xanthomendoza sp. 2 TL-2023]